MSRQTIKTHQSILGGAALIAFSVVAGAFIVASKPSFSAPTERQRAAEFATETGLPDAENPLPTEQAAREQFVAQVKNYASGKTFMIQNAKRTLRDVSVADIRFSHKKDNLLISYSLTWQPQVVTSNDCYLQDDSFGRYVGASRATWKIAGNGETGIPLTLVTIK